jgi:membrane protease YdiL (CAAX protease family)
MKTISPVKFTLATFAFTWSLLAIAILSGQSSKDFPAILFYIIGGCCPSLVALFFVWRNFNAEQRREFWSRVFSLRRVKPIWWIVTLIVVPAAMLLGVWVNALLGGTSPQMDYVNLLKAQPAEIPIFIIMMMIGGPLAEELGWRGILLDAFQRKWSAAVSTLVLFLVWWAWHLPMFFLPGTTQYDWGLFGSMFWLFAMNVFLLTILMTLAHNANQRSVLAAILIHFSYNVTLSLLVPYSVQTFAFMTTFLAALVVGILVFQKVSGLKDRSTRQEVQP